MQVAPVLFPVRLPLVLALVLVLNVVAAATSSSFAVQAAPEASRITYYVAQDGDDGSRGTELLPWRTIAKAASTLVAGDTVYITAGTYGERVVPRNSGSVGLYITYAAYPGDSATIDGSGILLPEWGGLVTIADREYIRVSGLRVINAGPHMENAGILVDGSSHIVIEDNYTRNTVSSGIGVWGSEDIVIAGNEVELACNDGEQECITVAGTRSFEIRNNHVHHGGPGSNGGEGIDAKDGSSYGKVYGNHVHHVHSVGIYVDAWDKRTHDIEVYRNIVHDVAGNGIMLSSEMGGRLERVRVFNNIAYHNQWGGIWLSGCCPEADSHPMAGIQIVNNTLYNNGWEPWGGGIGIENADIEDAVIRNNICSQNLSFQIALDPSVPAQAVTIDHNLVDGYRASEGEVRGDKYVEGDPLFVDPSAVDLHLRAGSPAIDSGSPAGAPADDIDGQPRPQGRGYDIGADERLAVSGFRYLPLIWR